jgi:hypothetical protein
MAAFVEIVRVKECFAKVSKGSGQEAGNVSRGPDDECSERANLWIG